MAQAKNGDTVKVHYTGKLEDGTVFDSSLDRDPVEFTIGEGDLISGFERAVMGMESGDSKTITIPAEQGYGAHHEELVTEVEKDQFPPDIEAKVGQQLQLQSQDGRQMIVTVTEVSDSSVKLDANHPLAGKDLTFDLQLVEIV